MKPLPILLFFLLLLTACGNVQRDEDGTIVAAGDLSVYDLRVGDCFDNPSGAFFVTSVDARPCSEPHDNEVFFLIRYPAGEEEPFPGEEPLDRFAGEHCRMAFAAYVGTPYESSVLEATYIQPTIDSWRQGDRQIACLLTSLDEPLVGSEKGSQR